MILGIGTDLLDVARMARELEKEAAGFRDAVFTPSEISYCQGKRHPARHFAAHFAAKEALYKALGGAVPSNPWLDIELEHTDDAPPRLRLRGPVQEAADRLGVKAVLVSLSHASGLATASVVLEG